MKRVIASILLTLSSSAYALQESTRENLRRLQEKLREAIEDYSLDQKQLSPLTLVDVRSTHEDPATLTNAVLSELNEALRITVVTCDSCKATYASNADRSIYHSAPTDVQEIRSVYLGQQLQPKAAAWVALDQRTLSVRIVSLDTSQVLFAHTIDSEMDWSARSLRSFSQSRQAERSARGDVILHSHWDFGVNPFGSSSHVGYSYLQQWGSYNQYLSGLCFNLTDPVFGFGFATFKAFSEFNEALVGGKFLINTPQLLARSIDRTSDNNSALGPPLNLVVMIKYPLFGRPEKFYANAFLGTSGSFGIGLSW